MSALQGMQANGLSDSQRNAISALFWQWYHSHLNDVILKRRILIINVTIKVKDARFLFEMLFGVDPTGFEGLPSQLGGPSFDS